MIRHSTVDRIIEYDPVAGLFRYKVSMGYRRPGTQAGGTGNGIYLIGIDNKRYYGSTIAYILMNKEEPAPLMCNFKDGNHLNLKWNNMEWITYAETVARSADLPNEKYPGVSRPKWTDKYQVIARWHGEPITLGLFDTFEEAVAAKRASDEVRPHPWRRSMS